MRVFSGIGQLKKPLSNVVAAVGVFDGVHRGHRAVITRAVTEARRIHGTSVVVTFYPHPVQALAPDRFSSYLTSLNLRLEHLAELGVDACLVVRFTRRFASMLPLDFIQKYFVRKLQVKKIVVGEDFHFGRGRQGSLSYLSEQGHRYGFTIEPIPLLKLNNKNIKTSLIRELIVSGQIKEASRFLGRPVTLRGRVIRGDAKGRQLGFPTANMQQENVVIPPAGIYLAHVFLGKQKKNALFYIGQRPSFKTGRVGVNLEAYILDFHGQIYGREIRVELLKKIREDAYFSDEKELVKRIQKDEQIARKFFFR